MPKCAISTKIIPATCAWMLLLGCTGLFFAFSCRYLMFEYSIGIAIYQSILTIYVISNFGLSTFMDPGIYPKASNELVKDGDMPAPLHKSLDINNVTVRLKWCNTCKFYRPPRSTHCGVCDCCIEVFDHHCPWVNNCVGRRNYRYFFQFLISLTLHMFSIFALCLVFVLDHREDLRTKENIISLCIMVVIGLLCIPVVGLTCFHVVLISRGRTTNEQVTGKMRGTSNPYNLGCAKNCCYLFCGPTWPRMLNRTPSSSKMVNNINNSMATYIASENKVKIYMEEPNGVQRGGNKDYNKMTPGNYQLSAQEYEYLNTPSSNNSANYFEQPCARLIEGSGENGALLPSANYGQASGISHLPPRPNTLKMSTGTPLASDMKYPTSQALQPHALQVPVDRSRCSSGNSPTRISVIPPKTFPVISHPIVVPRDPSVLQGLTIRHTKESGYTSEGASRPLLTMEELNNGPLRRFSGSNRASVRPPPPARSAAIASGMQNVYDRSSLLYGTNQHYVVRQDSDITEYKV